MPGDGDLFQARFSGFRLAPENRISGEADAKGDRVISSGTLENIDLNGSLYAYNSQEKKCRH